MKKLLAILLCLVMVLGLAACAGKQTATEEPAKTDAATTTAEPTENTETPTEAEQPAETEQTVEYPKTAITFSFFGAETTPSGMGVAHFKELVEERSGGNVTVNAYYNGTLYNQSTEYEALMKGDVDMIVATLNYAREYIPELKTTFCPYMWESIDHVRDFWSQNETGAGLMKRLEDELGVRQLTWFTSGYRNVCLNKDLKVTSREDLAKIKLRSSPAENMIAMTAALGGNPISIPFSDCYLGIQTGVADGLEVDLTGLIANGLSEVTQSVTLTQHYLSLDGFAMNYANYQKWDPAVQELITACAEETALYIDELSAQTDADALQQVKDLGIIVYDLTDEERKAYGDEVRAAFIASDFAANYDMDLFNAICEMGKNY